MLLKAKKTMLERTRSETVYTVIISYKHKLVTLQQIDQINIGYPEMLLLNAFLNVNVNVNLLKY